MSGLTFFFLPLSIFPPLWLSAPPWCVSPVSNYPGLPRVYSLCAPCSLAVRLFQGLPLPSPRVVFLAFSLLIHGSCRFFLIWHLAVWSGMLVCALFSSGVRSLLFAFMDFGVRLLSLKALFSFSHLSSCVSCVWVPCLFKSWHYLGSGKQGSRWINEIVDSNNLSAE